MARPRKTPPAAQPAIAVRNQYDAAGRGRRMKGWNPPTSGPNQAVTPGIQPLRNRARDATRNDWAGESSTQKWVTTLIGVGITPRLKRVKSARRKKVLNDLWDAWVQQSDADGVLNFYGQQALATRAWLESGEVFARLRVRRMDGDMAVPLQVQLIESDYVPHFDSDSWPGMSVGTRFVAASSWIGAASGWRTGCTASIPAKAMLWWIKAACCASPPTRWRTSTK